MENVVLEFTEEEIVDILTACGIDDEWIEDMTEDEMKDAIINALC